MKTVRELEAHDQQTETDAVVRGNNAVINSTVLEEDTIKQTRHKEETMIHCSDLEKMDICESSMQNYLNNISSVESLKDSKNIEVNPSPATEFIVKYLNNTVTDVEPGNISLNISIKSLQQNMSDTENIIQIRSSECNEEITAASKVIGDKEESMNEKVEQLNSFDSIPKTSLNVLDEPLFPDFSLSVLRFQEAIESFTQAVFSDAFDSLIGEKNSINGQDTGGQTLETEKEHFLNMPSNENCPQYEIRENNNHFHSCELSGENSVNLCDPVESEIIEEYFESQTATLCGESKLIEESLTVHLQFTDVQGEENSDDCKENLATELNNSEQSRDSLVWTSIPIHRAHSDSAAITRDKNVLTITDVSDLGCTEDYTMCSPVIQEVDDPVLKKSAIPSKNITFEDVSSSEYIDIVSQECEYSGRHVIKINQPLNFSVKKVVFPCFLFYIFQIT